MEKPCKRRKYNAAFKAEVLCVASASRRPCPASHPKLLYKWQQEALPTLPSDPAEVRHLRAADKRPAQEPEILKKPLPSSAPRRPREPPPVY